MSPARARTVRSAAVCCAAAGALIACGHASSPNHTASQSTSTIAATDLQNTLTQQINTAADRPIRSLTCDRPVAATVGASSSCVLTAADGNITDLAATVSTIDDGHVEFDVTPSLSQRELQRRIGQIVTRQNPEVTVKAVECDGGLSDRVGQTRSCTVRSADRGSLTFRVTVTDRTSPINVAFEVADIRRG